MNGEFVRLGDGSVYGVAEVGSIELSKDVPQFKKKESAAGRVQADEDGTTHELSGGWNAKTDAIIVWRRASGKLEVISGRHRLAHARKNGVQHIAVRVYDETAEHDAAWAKLYDVEVNILANTCNAIDVAYYFRHNPMSLGEAEARGLMPKTRAGEQTAASRMGLEIAAKASDETFDALINGVFSVEDVHMACVIAGSPEGQALALAERQGKNGKKQSWEYVTALVRGSEQMSGGGAMLDLFGWDTGFKEKAEKMARYVEAVRGQLKQRIQVLASAGGLQRRADVARREGVKAERPKDAVERMAKLAQLDAAYERMDAGLGIAEKADAWDGKSAVAVDESIDHLPLTIDQQENRQAAPAGGASFSVSPTLREDIHKAYENRTRKDTLIPLCSSPRVFGALGLEVADIVTEARTIRKLYGKGVSEEEIVRAVEQFDDALAIIRDSDSSVILLPGMLAKNQSGELADVQAAIHLQRTNNGEHYMASLYALDDYQKIEAQLKQGHLIYSKYTKEDLEANNGALDPKVNTSSTLVRLLTSLGLSRGNVTTEKDLVKGENSENPNLSFSLTESREAALRELRAEAEETAEKLRKAARENGGKVYIRWGENIKRDSEPGYRSMNWSTMRREAGMSVMAITPDMSTTDIILTLKDYMFTRMHGKRKPVIYAGDEVGIGADGEPLISNQKMLGYVDLRKMERFYNGRELVEVMEDIDRSKNFLAANADLAKKSRDEVGNEEYGRWLGVKIVKESLEKKMQAIDEYIAEKRRRHFSDSEVRTMRKNYGEASFSVTSAQAQGLFKDGVMEAGNAVITEPSFSISAQHVSPHRFKLFDLEHIGEGTGEQAFGWGLYFMTNWEENSSYYEDFSWKRKDVFSIKGKVVDEDAAYDAFEELNVYEDVELGSKSDYKERIANLKKQLDERDFWYYDEEDLRERIDDYERLLEAELFKDSVLEHPMNYLVDLEVEDGELLDWNKWIGYGRREDFYEHELATGLQFSPIGEDVRALLGKEALPMYNGKTLYFMLEQALGSQKAASEWLLARGIKGIRYVDGATRSSEGEKTYNYVIFDPSVIKVRKVAERKPWSSDTEDASIWQDYEGWKDSFSLRGQASVLDRVNLRELAEEEAVVRLMNRARRGINRWRRVFAGDETGAAAAAQALGEVGSVMEAVLERLPAGKRPKYARQMQVVEAYARVIETGRVRKMNREAKGELSRRRQEVLREVMAELEKLGKLKGEALREMREMYTRQVAERRLEEVVIGMVEEAVGAMERHLVEREVSKLEALAERLAPKKKANGKLAKGKMSAAAYREFARLMGLVRMTAEEKAARLEELQKAIEAEQSAADVDEGKVEELTAQVREVAMFGALGEAGLVNARRGVAALVEYARTERMRWTEAQDLERRRMKHIAGKATRGLGGADELRLAEVKARSGRLSGVGEGIVTSFQSLSQMFYALQGVEGLEGFAGWSLDTLARGNVQLAQREQAWREKEREFMARELGLDTEAKRNNFVAEMKVLRRTDVAREGEMRRHRVRLTVEEARELAAMSKAEREARNEELRRAAEAQGVDAENIVGDEDMALLMDELAKKRAAGGQEAQAEMQRRVMEQAEANIEPLRGIVSAAAEAVGGKVMMRPANNENGKETKAPSTAFAKAARDYGGDISRVVDLIGGTCVMPESGSYADAVEAIRAALPEGCSIAKVKKLGFGGTEACYQDVKVSIRFANGGIGEVILVSEHMNDAKFNRGGHAVYELSRVIAPLKETDTRIEEAWIALNKLSSAIYAADVNAEDFERAKDLASSAVQHLPLDLMNASLSSDDMMVVKSSSSLLNAAKPLSVNSAAIPSSSEIKNDISDANVSEGGGNVNKKNARLAETQSDKIR